MKAEAKPITVFMDGKDKRFMIPVYQRNYSWTRSTECQTLWDDLLYIINSGKNSKHFFGSVVSVIDSETSEFIIIDGQQRLTTVSLLLLAIAHRAKEYIETIQQHESYTVRSIPDPKEVLSLCIDSKKSNKLKLKLIRSDMIAYQSLIDNKAGIGFEKTHIVQNYKYFYNNIKLENINDIYNAVKQLEIVDIKLGPDDDNPQLVFESLNTKGMDLTAADQIRNFVLIGLDYQEQERLYQVYWQPMEENSGISPDDPTKFIWNYLTMKTNKKILSPDTYKQFKEYKNKQLSTEELLKDLLYFSEIYDHIQTQSFEDANVNVALENLLRDMKFTSATPLLMDAFDKQYKGLLTYNEVVEIIRIIETYFVRRTVCRYKTAGTDKMFLLNKKIDSIMAYDDTASYLDVFKYLINSDTSSLKFPDDQEFSIALPREDIYSNSRNVCKYILATIEKHHNPKEYIDTNPLSIEHIMPQILKDAEWKQNLGDNWERIHKDYVHTLGNLTLTGYNSEYSNRPFRYKKRCSRGFDYSPLHLNSMLKEIETWNEEQIQKRAKILSYEAQQIWHSYKATKNYQVIRDVSIFSLDNADIDSAILGRKPQSFYFEVIDKECSVSSWKDLYIQIINCLYETDKYKQKMDRAFAFGNNGIFANIISKRQEPGGQKGEIFWEQIIPDNPIYFRTNKSSIDLLKAIKVWFEYLDINTDELSITLKNK